MHACRRPLIVAVAIFAVAVDVSTQQPEAPTLTRQERAALQSLIRAADSSTADVALAADEWPLHVLRASDGSHYVAFSINRAEGLSVDKPSVVYVRLVTKRPGGDPALRERSAVAEWLAGQAPMPVLPRRGLAFGEMPTYGAAGIGQRSAGLQAQNLQVLELERERARVKAEDQERARKAALEGGETARAPRPVLPFEDFDFRAHATRDSSGAAVLRRSLTSGPGEYELVVAWTDAAGDGSAVRVARRDLSLPPASRTGLALSTVIVADDVTVRETPIPATEQASRPYSIGTTDITPARDHILTVDERLALVVQVINPRGTPAGKPDVEVGFRVFRRNGPRDENIGSLAPQSYNQLTLPFDFDVAKGHPIFAAVAVPLRNFKRGEYRIEIAANDRIAGAGVINDVPFTVAATPAALLREAPALATVFDPKREALPATVSVMFGAIRASEGNDREALAAWQAAIDGGADAIAVWPAMIDAALRLRDTTQASDLARNALSTVPGHARVTRQLASALLMAERHDEALRTLEPYLQSSPDDLEAQWLAIHALFASLVSGTGPGATPAGRARLIDLATHYANANGPHATLARDWANAVK